MAAERYLGRSSQSITRMVDAFCTAVIDRYYEDCVKLPTYGEMKVCMEFMEQHRAIPMCIGALDGTHFPITNGAKLGIKYKSPKKVT